MGANKFLDKVRILYHLIDVKTKAVLKESWDYSLLKDYEKYYSNQGIVTKITPVGVAD
mgnify:CR=1 FL=1